MLTAWLLALAVSGSPAPSVDRIAERADAVARAVLGRPVAGISVAVARDGEVIFARGYGVANLEHAVPVTPETVFHIASISKNILAAVVVRLADEGKLSLDDDVTKWVPEAPTRGRHVTVRQLLDHTSGIFSFTSLPEAAANERLDLTHEQVLALIKEKAPDFEPGAAWRYDNSGFYLAGMVVERVTGQDYGTYVREHVFSSLRMTSACLCDARAVVPNLASGYEVEARKLVHASLMSWKLPFAAGSICATATDLLTWQAALEAGRVVAPRSLARMRSPTVLADGTAIDYGLGTRLGSLEGHRVVGHTGGGGGFGTVLESFPDDHLTIAVLVNTGNGSGPALTIATAIARAALGLPEKPTLRDLAVPQPELAALAGRYDSDEGPVENFIRDGKLYFRLPGTPVEGQMFRQDQNLFAVDENTQVRIFVRGGRATWAQVYSGGMMVDAKQRVPQTLR